jgi:CRP-like cAMP-binding protein/Tfp pilus assembly protein PilF
MQTTSNRVDPFKNTLQLNQIAALYQEEIRLLMASFSTGGAGSLHLVECNSLELQARLFEYFRLRLETEQIYLYPFELTRNHLSLAKSLAELAQQPHFKELTTSGKYQSVIFFVHGLEKLSDADRNQFFLLLNFLRDRFANLLQPVVLWGTSPFITDMADHAPDIWTQKSGLYQFQEEVYEAAMARSDGLETLSPVQHYMSALQKDPDYSVWRELYLPLKAVHIAESVNLISSRHTYTDDELSQLTAVLPAEIETIPANQIIFQKGDASTKCYVLLDGEVDVIVPAPAGDEVIIDRLGRGDFFGEIALIKNVPRTATIKSRTPCKYIVVTKPSLRRVAAKITHLLEFMGNIAERRFEAINRTTPGMMSPLRRFANQSHLIQPAQMPADVFDLIKADEKITVLGEAGTGKTTALRALTLDLIDQAQSALSQGNFVRLPLFIKLNALTSEKTIEDLLLNTFQSYGLTQFETRADVEKFLKNAKQPLYQVEHFIFIMDGLNEMPDLAANQQTLNRFLEAYSNQQMVISCRTQDYRPVRGFKSALLQPLSEEDIEAFLAKYMNKEMSKNVAGEIMRDQQLIDLAQSPLALYMFTQITQQGTESLPKNRGILFERFTDNLLERIDTDWWKTYRRPQATTPLATRKQLLADLGFAMQTEQVTTYAKSAWLDTIPAKLTLNKRTIKREALLDDLILSGLIRYTSEHSKQHIEFTHHTYQEFFAALALRDQDTGIEPYLASDELLRHWYGVIKLLYSISPQKTNLFSQILGLDNDYARIWLAAQCLAAAGEELAVATERFEQDLPRNQRFAMRFSVGLAGYLQTRYPEALAHLLQAAEEEPGNAEVQYELGSLYRQLNQYERAITHLKEAFHLRPDFVDAYNQLGITYYNQGKFEEALTIFQAATQLESTNPHHYYNLGAVQKVRKDYEAARNAFQIALRLKKDYTEARNQLDLLEKALSSGVVQVLNNIPMLGKLTLEQTLMLANRLKVNDYKAGRIVFHMGETGDTFYIIEEGEVEVLAPDIRQTNKDTLPVINTLKAGDFFGEIALLQAVPRTATIRCTTGVRLLELSREDFADIINNYPSIAHSLAETSLYRRYNDQMAGRYTDYHDGPTYLQRLLEEQDDVTVLMGDIHGSSFLTNSIGPELMVEFLDEYLLRMSTIITNAGGVMDKSLGDSVMGVFGYLKNRPGETQISPAVRSIIAGLQMRETYLNLRQEWKERSPVFMQTGMGIGINTGQVKIGTVGAERAMVGSAVNISSKLSKMAIKGRNESEIYIDDTTFNMLKGSIEVELLDPGYVINKAGGVNMKAYRVVRNINLKLEAGQRSMAN